MTRVAALAAVITVAISLASCGGRGSDADERVTVFAAASLTEVFEELDPQARFNFAGSDELATQLREGADADVLAAASPKYPDALHEEGIVDQPRVFATNRLVVVVPRDNAARIVSWRDVARPGVRLVVGAPNVPVGDYTRQALAAGGLQRALRNVVSEEEDVKGVLGKVRLGEADAGFVYATDAVAAGDGVRAIAVPATPDVRYPIAVVNEGDRGAAAAFVRLVLSTRGQRLLREAGFGAPARP